MLLGKHPIQAPQWVSHSELMVITSVLKGDGNIEGKFISNASSYQIMQ